MGGSVNIIVGQKKNLQKKHKIGFHLDKAKYRELN